MIRQRSIAAATQKFNNLNAGKREERPQAWQASILLPVCQQLASSCRLDSADS